MSGLMVCAALALAGCESDADSSGDGGVVGDGGQVGDGDGATGTQDAGGEPLPNVPYAGDLPALPAGEEVDRQSYFPTNPGAVWRYRRKADEPQDPGPVDQGGETTLEAGTEENQVIRRTVTIIDGEIDDAPARIRQVITETLVVTPPDELVGPKIQVQAIEIEEREVETDRFVRVLERTYLPPYTLIEDAWKVGVIFTRIEDNMVRMSESVLLRGMEEPMETGGLIELVVETTPVGEQGSILTMECQFREGVREIAVYDDFSGMATRTYWVQQGVGPVQWRFRDADNITFTLTETNLEGQPPPCPAE